MNFGNRSIENQRTAADTESVALTGRTTFEKTLGKLTNDFFHILGVVGIAVAASAAVYEGASALGLQKDMTGDGGSLASTTLNENIDEKHIIQSGDGVQVKGVDRNFGFDDRIGSGISGNNAVLEGKIRSDLEGNGHDVVATMAVQLVANAEGRPGEWGQNLTPRNIGLAFTKDGSMWVLAEVDEFGVARGISDVKLSDGTLNTATIKLDARYATNDSKDKIIFGAGGVDMFSILIGPNGSKSIAAIDTINGKEINCSAVKVDAVLKNVNITPTPPVSPELTALQERIAGNPETSKFVLHLDNGVLELDGQDTGLRFVDGAWRLTLADGTVVSNIEKNKVHLSDKNGVDVDGYDYNQGWNVEVVKDYPICSISEFQKCVFPEEDFFNGNFQRWHETMPHQFVEGQVDLRPWTQETGSRGLLYQDKTIKRTIGAVSVWVDPAEGITNSEGYDNRVIPFQLPDPSDPYNPEKNIYVTGVSLMNYVKNGVLGKPLMGGDIKYLSDVLQNRTNQLLIVPGFTYPNTAVVIPLVKKTWETLGAEKMQSIITRVAAGDPTALRELNGMPILLLVGDTTDW